MTEQKTKVSGDWGTPCRAGGRPHHVRPSRDGAPPQAAGLEGRPPLPCLMSLVGGSPSDRLTERV